MSSPTAAHAEGRTRDRHFLLQPCRNTAAYELLPRRKKLKLDLKAAKAELVAAGYGVVVDARVMLIVERECIVNLWPSGRLLIRTLDEPLAQKVARELSGLLY